MMVPRRILPRMSYILDESCTENQTNILHSIIFIYENRAVHGVIWKNTVSKTGHRWQYPNKIRCMPFACRLAKATIPTHL
jgi:hypothetical protein